MKDSVRAMVVGLLVALPVAAVLAGRFLVVNRDLLGGSGPDPWMVIPSFSIALPVVLMMPLVGWGLREARVRVVRLASALVCLSLVYAVVVWPAANIRADSDALYLVGVWIMAATAVFAVGVAGSVMAVVVIVLARRRARV